MRTRILAMEPFYGGSHRAFLDGWIAHSRHEWTVMGLPARKWKWRMRHAPITFARQCLDRAEAGQSWDVLFCSDMLNLAEFLGLAAAHVRELPVVAYFHENQLTYPVRDEHQRDLHFAFTNITTAEAATQVWFNSAFHRDEFLGAIPGLLKRMPDYAPLDLGECEPGVGSGHDEVTRHGDLEAATEGDTLDCRDQGLLPHSADDAVLTTAFGAVTWAFRQVGSSAEY